MKETELLQLLKEDLYEYGWMIHSRGAAEACARRVLILLEQQGLTVTRRLNLNNVADGVWTPDET